MSEHGFLALMLGLAMGETLLLGVVLGYFVYRIDRKSERIAGHSEHLEGMIAATYLRMHRALTQLR